MKKGSLKPPKLDIFKHIFSNGDLARKQGLQEVGEYISSLNSRYKHWDDLRYLSHPQGLTQTDVWAFLKFSRFQIYERLKFGGEIFLYALNSFIQKNLHEIDIHAAGNLEVLDLIPPKEDSEKYVINSLMEEAISSSQLEGAATSRKVAKEMLRKGTKPKNNHEQMILNSYRALKYIKTKNNESLTPQLLKDIQKIVTVNTIDEKSVGVFRSSDDVIVSDKLTGEIIHEPPSHKKINSYVDELCKFANNENQKAFVHPIIKAIILHFLIGYIHPFEDGNGRTARTIFYWYVLKKGYWLFEYLPISRVIKNAPSKYSRAYLLTETDDNDLTYFILFNLRQIDISIRDLKVYLTEKRKEMESIKSLVAKDGRLNYRQSEIILDFTKHPLKYYTISEIQNTYHIVYQTARTDLEHLHKLGYTRKIAEGKKFLFQKK